MENPFYTLDLSGGGMRCPPGAMTPITPSGSAIPPAVRVRLYELFLQIEKEFEQLYTENLGLQDKIDWLSTEQQLRSHHRKHQPQHQQQQPQLQQHQQHHGRQRVSTTSGSIDIMDPPTTAAATPTATLTPTPSSASMTSLMNTMAANLPKGMMAKGIYAHKIRSHTNKLRQQTNRIMSNLKGPPSMINCTPRRRFVGHKDGIWEVSCSKLGLPMIGTASADHTVIVWNVNNGRPLLQYNGHAGSVNSVRFHPNKELVITSSGDGAAHIWQCAVHLFGCGGEGRIGSLEDDPAEAGPDGEGGDSAAVFDDANHDVLVLRTPLRPLHGHGGGVVIAADWLPGGDQAVTAGWDRLACIWDTNTGQLLHQLTGHDEELTNTAVHPTSRLVVTTSKDSTFRLWDFREAIHSVSVFQGHQDTVTSAVFTREDQVVSGSDDRSVRIWDLRNMRSPLATIHTDSPVNRISVSSSGMIAIPLDNRNVRLYDLSGQRLGRLPRSSRQGHTRMVCSTTWSPMEDARPNLFTCGFDKICLGWNIDPIIKDSNNEVTGGGGGSNPVTFSNSGPSHLGSNLGDSNVLGSASSRSKS